jgi:CheY-like chemotaxis protein
MSKKTILVVDDDDDVRDAVSELLENHGYAVVPASNGKEALHELKMQEVRPAMILLDLMMPIMDGQEFCAEQQADPDLRNIPVVVFSAFDPGSAQKDLPRVEKPVQAEQLLDSVDHWSGSN